MNGTDWILRILLFFSSLILIEQIHGKYIRIPGYLARSPHRELTHPWFQWDLKHRSNWKTTAGMKFLPFPLFCQTLTVVQKVFQKLRVSTRYPIRTPEFCQDKILRYPTKQSPENWCFNFRSVAMSLRFSRPTDEKTDHPRFSGMFFVCWLPSV